MIRTTIPTIVRSDPLEQGRRQPNGKSYRVGDGRRNCAHCIPPRPVLLWLSALIWALGSLAAPARVGAQQRAAQTSQAQPGKRAPGGEVGSEARRHFASAMAHYRARRFREAIHDFELSIAKVPSAAVWFNIGRAHEQLGEFRLAVESYRRYLRDDPNAPDALELAAHIDALTSRSEASASALARNTDRGALAIDADQAGAVVLLDGRRLGVAPIDRILEVTPGSHRLHVSREGYVPFRSQVEVQPGALSAAYVDLQPLTAHRHAAGPKLWTWLAVGASAAALLTSGAFGVVALDNREQGDFAGARRWARASDFTLGGALTLAVSATILHFASAAGGDVKRDAGR
jgi:tetratricopeptide (TPR) repeat protein